MNQSELKYLYWADAHHGKHVDADRDVLISWEIFAQEDFLTNEIVY